MAGALWLTALHKKPDPHKKESSMGKQNRWRGAALAVCLVLSAAPAALATNDMPADAIAKVGDQIITMGQIDSMLNSSSMVGMTIPAPGTPERNRARLTILDKVISANLIYLDALRAGMQDNPVFRHDVERLTDSVLADLYREKYLIGDIPITEQEIQAYRDRYVAKDAEFTDDVRLAVEARVRKDKFQQRVATLRERLRKGVDIAIMKDALAPEGEKDRKSDTVVATVDGQPMTWGEVRDGVMIADTVDQRVQLLDDIIDARIEAEKGREAGLAKDPVYQARLKEFQKVRLINLRRAVLTDEINPTADELRAFYNENRSKIVVPASRKVQMVVLPTREQAEEVKKKIDAGEITIFEAARDYSIDPNAKRTLGEIGWVSEGSGFPELDNFTFALEPGKLGGPVESPAGWHLVKVLDTRNAAHTDPDEANTRRLVRRMYMHHKLDEYTTKLRKESFPVAVFQDTLQRIMQAEAGEPEAKEEGTNKE
jgi:parvulin-like peptidyl-prolyl isomerase